LRFIEFWKQQTGKPPRERVLDLPLPTSANLRRLEEQAIRFLMLRRRTRKLLAEIYAPRFRLVADHSAQPDSLLSSSTHIR